VRAAEGSGALDRDRLRVAGGPAAEVPAVPGRLPLDARRDRRRGGRRPPRPAAARGA